MDQSEAGFFQTRCVEIFCPLFEKHEVWSGIVGMVSVRHESEPGKSFEHFHEVFDGDIDGNDDGD